MVHTIARDFPVMINDALLVAALLSVDDDDQLHPENLAAVLRVTIHTSRGCFGRGPSPLAGRVWPSAISRLRSKALVNPQA